MKSIAVYCGSSDGTDPDIIVAAKKLGATLAKRNTTVIYGGAKIGIMGAVAQSALDNGGNVTGVLPNFLQSREVRHSNLTKMIITENMQDRKLQMHELSDAIITLPGGYGTLEELFEMLSWAQLGLHKKPIGLLNTNGFYDSLLIMLQKMVSDGFLKQEGYDLLLVDATVEGLLKKMDAFLKS